MPVYNIAIMFHVLSFVVMSAILTISSRFEKYKKREEKFLLQDNTSSFFFEGGRDDYRLCLSNHWSNKSLMIF